MSWNPIRVGAVLAILAIVNEPRSTTACPVLPPDKAEVITLDLGSTGPIQVEVKWFDAKEGGFCTAGLSILRSQLPSLRLVPRPIELAEAIGPVVRKWDATECSIFVQLINDTNGELEPYDQCWWGEYEYTETAWWPRESDHQCWEPAA